MSTTEDLSLREELIQAFKESETAEPTETETQDVDASADDNDQPAQSEPEAAASQDESTEEPKEAKDDKSKADSGSEEKKQDALAPPDRWTAEQKEEFAALDPGIQKILLDRNKGLEASYTKRMMEIAQERQRFNSIEQALAPHRQSWAGTGWDDAKALENIMGYWQHAQADPMGFISRFAEERGIDLASQFAPSTDEILAYLNQSQGVDSEGNPLPQQQAAIHPDVRRQMQAYEQRLNQLQQTVQQQHGYLSQAEQQRMAQERAQAEQQLDAFINATDESGRPKHEFYEDLKPEMIKLMEAGVTQSLEEAYERALWGNPQTRSKLMETQTIQQRREQERREQEEAERARRASASVVGSGVPPAPSNDEEDDDSIRGILMREMNRQSRRASGLI